MNAAPVPGRPSALLTGLLGLVPPSGEPAPGDLETISRDLEALSIAERATLLTALGHALAAGRTPESHR